MTAYPPPLSRDSVARDAAMARAEQYRARLDQELEYAAGYREGYETGYAAAHREMAAWWAALAAMVRGRAERWSPYGQRRARELQWARPRPGDYAGRLTSAEYFGVPRPAGTSQRTADAYDQPQQTRQGPGCESGALSDQSAARR